MTTTFNYSVAAHLRRFRASTAGVAAIEFAYILPLLVLMTVGVFEVSRGVLAHKRFQRATAMVGDLVAREQQLGTTKATAKTALDGIMRAAEHAMRPYNTTTLQIGISAIRASPTDATDTRVEWSYPYRNYPVTACSSPKAMPAAGMITKGNAAIVVEAQYKYKPFTANLIPGFGTVLTWRDTITHAPRNGTVVYGCAAQCTGGC